MAIGMKPTRKTIGLVFSIIGAIVMGAFIVLERHALHLLQDTVALICLGLVELVSISTVLYEAAKEHERFLFKPNVNMRERSSADSYPTISI
jgi:hypothetical protein